MPEVCAREGCTRWARSDEFCSTMCFREANGTLGDFQTAKQRKATSERVRRLEKKLGASYVDVENTDATTRLAAGSAGTGPRRNQWTKPQS